MTNDHHGSENVARDVLGWTRAKKIPSFTITCANGVCTATTTAGFTATCKT